MLRTDFRYVILFKVHSTPIWITMGASNINVYAFSPPPLPSQTKKNKGKRRITSEALRAALFAF